MNYSDLENILTGIVDSLEGIEPEKNSILFDLKLRGWFFNKQIQDVGWDDLIRIKILVKRNSNYKTVFWSWEGNDWEFTSHHDSCWRTDGMRPACKLWFDMRAKLLEYIKNQKMRVNIETVNSSINFERGILKLFKFVNADVERCRDDSYGYVLKSINEN